MKTALAALLLAAALAPALGGCASTASDGPCERGIVTTLYLGRSIAGGGVVDDAALARFLDEVAGPKLPDGFTVLRGEGWWHAPGAPASGHEDSIALQVVRCETKEAEQAVKDVAAAYAERFRQEAILRTDVRARIWW